MLERTRTSLRSLSSRLSRRQQVQGSDAELLAQLAQQIDPATYAALHGTCELPGLGDAQQERDALLRRYLEAEKRCVAGAAARLAQQAEWRRRFGTVTEEQVPAQIAAQKVLLQPPPPAAPAARPLVVVAVRRHLPAGGGDLAELERFIVLILDTASAYCWDARSNPPAQLAALFDLRGIRRKNLQLPAVQRIFSLIERRYPEKLCALYLLDAPPLFHAMWYLVEPFIDAKSRQKLRFVSGEEGRRRLIQEMGAEVVPAELGGAARAVPIEEAVRRLPAWLEQQRQQRQQRQEGQRQQEAGQAVLGKGALEPPEQQLAGLHITAVPS